MLKEFQAFAMRGNVVDMAVGIIIGGAFGTIVKSFVDDILMPPIGWMTGGVDFAALAVNLPVNGADGAPVSIGYGAFINAVISFLIVAWALFMLIKAMNTLQKNEAAKPAEPEKDPKDVLLLQEIRDLLAKQGS